MYEPNIMLGCQAHNVFKHLLSHVYKELTFRYCAFCTALSPTPFHPYKVRVMPRLLNEIRSRPGELSKHIRYAQTDTRLVLYDFSRLVNFLIKAENFITLTF
jgi:hypothetical protein